MYFCSIFSLQKQTPYFRRGGVLRNKASALEATAYWSSVQFETKNNTYRDTDAHVCRMAHHGTRTHTCAERHIMGHGRTHAKNGTSWDTDAHVCRMAHHGTRTHTCAEQHIKGHGRTHAKNGTSRDTDAYVCRTAHQETRTHTCAERHIKRHGRTRVQNGTSRDTDAHVCRTAHQVSEQITKRSPTTTSCGPSGARLLGFLPSTCGVRFSSVSESVSHNEYCIITNENNKLQLRRNLNL